MIRLRAFVTRGSPEQFSSLEDCPSTFRHSGIARAAFSARGLPEYLSPLGDCPSSFRHSGIARVPFVTRGLPEQLSSFGDCPSNFLRSGITRAPFVAQGWSEHFHRWMFLIAIGLYYSIGLTSIGIHRQMVSTSEKGNSSSINFKVHQLYSTKYYVKVMIYVASKATTSLVANRTRYQVQFAKRVSFCFLVGPLVCPS
jgi:hypothetical protein